MRTLDLIISLRHKLIAETGEDDPVLSITVSDRAMAVIEREMAGTALHPDPIVKALKYATIDGVKVRRPAVKLTKA